MISENHELFDFESKCKKVETHICNSTDFITITQFKEIFGDLHNYLLIPHYGKNPILRQDKIQELNQFIFAGEVTSPKKFQYCIKDPQSLVPVLFSDLRFSEHLESFSHRQTFIKIDDTSLKNIKICLLDKAKVFLSQKESHGYFQVFEDGQILSTGLNVILGERSSGKTNTLNRIYNTFANIKYIKQFELLETDKERDKEKFNKLLSAKKSSVSELFLKEFKTVVDDIKKIDQKKNDIEIEQYLNSLLTVASEEEQQDVYAQATIFNETQFTETEYTTLKNLISSVELLIENKEYRELIDKHISILDLTKLILDLMFKYREVHEKNGKKLWVNSLVSNIKKELKSFTASASINEIDFYRLQMEKEKLSKFEYIANLIKTERIIEQSDVRRFQIVASTRKYSGAQELLNKFGHKAIFSQAFNAYQNPIAYLEALKEIEPLPETEYYKYFINVDYEILNENGIPVSGGERSEFNLLEKIQDAHHYDMLLIDEPESSFDNLFLKNEVNELIRELSKSLPVVVVTHNNTVGASIKPDYILYTQKEVVKKIVNFKIYSGYPSDNTLKTLNGEEISNYNIMLNCLEAGDIAYYERGRSYEILKN